jgi:UMF1 family MFS transporter
MFDFANQAFTLVILTTMYHLYFVNHIVVGDEVRGRQLWATSGVVALLVVICLSPLIGALADFSGAKKRLLFTTYCASVVLTASLGLVPPGGVAAGMTVFILGYIFYAIGENFMAAFLPELAGHQHMGRVSAFGWMLGYIGGLCCLGGAAVIVAINDDQATGYRWVCLWAGLFFLASGVPTFLLLRERKKHEAMPAGQTMLTVGFHRLASTFRSLRRYRMLFRFLAIMTFYLGGMQIVIWFAGSIATKLFGLSEGQLALFMLVLTLTAIAGAFATGRFQDKIGTRRTIVLALILWLAVMIGAAFVQEPDPETGQQPSRVLFWVLGSGVGFGMGMLGTSSRAMVGLFSPPHKAAEFFGFYGLGTKIAAILGLLLSILAEEVFAGRYNLAVASSAVFFIGGLVLMRTVDEKAGRAVALEAAREHIEKYHDYEGEIEEESD